MKNQTNTTYIITDQTMQLQSWCGARRVHDQVIMAKRGQSIYQTLPILAPLHDAIQQVLNGMIPELKVTWFEKTEKYMEAIRYQIEVIARRDNKQNITGTICRICVA